MDWLFYINEYQISVPSAHLKGVANSGALLFSTQVLPVDSVKILGILYIPSEYFGRCLGILLPLSIVGIYRIDVTMNLVLR